MYCAFPALFGGGNMREFRKVTINGCEYPIRCNIRVLGEIQELYGALKQFELDIKGGEERVSEDGKKYLVRNRDASMDAVSMVLPLMVNEGCLLTGKEMLDSNEIIDGLETNANAVAALMEAEFMECFRRKK